MSNIVNFDALESALSARSYSDSYVQVPTKAIGSELKSQFGFIFDYFGLELPESFLTVKSEGGAFSTLFTPVMYSTPEENKEEDYAELAQKTGKTVDELYDPVGVRFGKNLIIPLSAFPQEEIDFEASETINIVNFYFEGYGEDGLIYPVKLILEDPQNALKAVQLKKLFSKGELSSILREVARGNQFFKVTELEEETDYKVVGYTSKEDKQYGMNYFLTLDTGEKVFSNTAIKKVLNYSPTITPEKPATLKVGNFETTSNNKLKANVVLQLSQDALSEVSDIDLDW